MKRKRFRKIFLIRVFGWLLPVLVFGAFFLMLYCRHLSTQIDERFSGRRWDVPSRIFSDTTLLYPGQEVNLCLLRHKLVNLGYQEVPHGPTRKGELRWVDSELDIYLHDLKTPSVQRTGIPVKISFFQNRVASIRDPDTKTDIPILELEPEEVMSFFGHKREQRQIISLDDVPQDLVHAVLAAEDTRFYQHRGVDLRAIVRAVYVDLRHGSIRQGGSTITQQLAKNYFLTPTRTLSRKLKELLMSLTMELMYDKNEILEIYLNEIYLGQRGSVSVNGVGEASYFYFGKPVNRLSLPEAATIAGLIRSPNYYSPYVNRRRCRSRRDQVLRAMRRQGWISDEQLATALLEPVKTVGYQSYGRKAPYFMDFLSSQLNELYPPEVLSSHGFTIYTTLDTQVQAAAEAALSRGLRRLEANHPELKREDPSKRLEGAVVVMQPKTGYVLAMAGGRDYRISQFNRITRARRQPGSAFKPFVYLSGLDRFTPASFLSNESRTYEVDGGIWEPRNYGDEHESRVTLRTALAESLNLATVDLAVKIGIDHVVETAQAFGFSTPFRPYLSLSLGAQEVVPLELARAYCVFAADGVLPYPLSLKAVVDENGDILERQSVDIKRVISPAKAFVMTSMLRSVMENGTGRSIKRMGITFPVAGKTGTTNGYRDAWFVGYTPDILALVWVGFDDGTSIRATGASAAMPIWAELMKSIPQYVSGEWFRMPPGVVRRLICADSGELAVPSRCPHPVEEVFLAGNVPERKCSIHRGKNVFQRLMGRIKDIFSDR